MKPFNDKGPFKVGELVRIIGSVNNHQLIGKEVIVLKFGEMNDIDSSPNFIGYLLDIKASKGYHLAAEEHNLRRVRPPEQSSGYQQVLSLFNDNHNNKEKEL